MNNWVRFSIFILIVSLSNIIGAAKDLKYNICDYDTSTIPINLKLTNNYILEAIRNDIDSILYRYRNETYRFYVDYRDLPKYASVTFNDSKWITYDDVYLKIYNDKSYRESLKKGFPSFEIRISLSDNILGVRITHTSVKYKIFKRNEIKEISISDSYMFNHKLDCDTGKWSLYESDLGRMSTVKGLSKDNIILDCLLEDITRLDSLISKQKTLNESGTPVKPSYFDSMGLDCIYGFSDIKYDEAKMKFASKPLINVDLGFDLSYYKGKFRKKFYKEYK